MNENQPDPPHRRSASSPEPEKLRSRSSSSSFHRLSPRDTSVSVSLAASTSSSDSSVHSPSSSPSSHALDHCDAAMGSRFPTPPPPPPPPLPPGENGSVHSSATPLRQSATRLTPSKTATPRICARTASFVLGEPLDPVPPDAAPYVVVAAVDAGGPDDDFGPFYTSERRG
eukprot:30004-Pelagococcus_subviridis.AAC.4